MPKRYKKTFAVIMKTLLGAGVPRQKAEELLELAPETVARWSAVHEEFRAALDERYGAGGRSGSGSHFSLAGTPSGCLK